MRRPLAPRGVRACSLTSKLEAFVCPTGRSMASDLAGSRPIVPGGLGSTLHPLLGQGFKCDGVTPGTRAYTPALNCTSAVTLAVWVTTGTGTFKSIFGKPFASSEVDPYFDYLIYRGDSLFNGRGMSVRIGSSSADVNLISADNTPYHFVFTADGTTWRFYVNGVQTYSAANAAVPTNTNSQALYIGGSSWAGETFDGSIYYGGVWSRALTAAEAWALYDPATRWRLLYAAPARQPWTSVSGVTAKAATETLKAVLGSEVGKSVPRIFSVETLKAAFGSEFAHPVVRTTPTETLRIGLTESQAVRVLVALGDTLRIGIAEALALLVRTPASDSLKVQLVEAGNSRPNASAAESLKVALSETAALAARVAAAESLRLALSEANRVVVRAAAAESARIGLADATAVYGRLSPSETLRVGLGEYAAVRASLAVLEALAVRDAEYGAVRSLATASETLRLALSEAAVALVSVRGSESLAVRVSDVVGSLRAILAVSEADRVGLSELAGLRVSFAAGESVRLSLSDAVTLRAMAAVSDAMRAALSESALSVVSVRASEPLAVTAVEAVGNVRAVVAVADALRIGVAEALALLVRLSVLDAPAVVLSENGALVVTGFGIVAIAASDPARLDASERTALLVAASVLDALPLRASDAAAIRSSLAVADAALRIQAAESPAVAVLVRAADSGRVAATEFARVIARVTAADADRIGMGAETARLFASLGVSELAIGVGVADAAPGIYARLAATDGASVVVGDSPAIMVRVAALAEALGVRESELGRSLALAVARDSIAVVATELGAQEDHALLSPAVPPSSKPGALAYGLDFKASPRLFRIVRRW